MIRVVVADDQSLVRAGIVVVLEASGDIQVVGQAKDGYEAVELAQQLQPDVVCMDIRMPGLNGIDATRQISEKSGGRIPVLIVTTFDLDDYVFSALEAGAAGLLLKGTDEDTLVSAIRSVASGEGTLDQQITRRVIAEFAVRRPSSQRRKEDAVVMFTPRELEILELLCAGLSNSEIAEQLFIELSTVKYHVAGLMTKTGARDRLQTVIWAFRNGAAVPPQPS